LLGADGVMEAERILFLHPGQLDQKVAKDRIAVVYFGVDGNRVLRQSLETDPAEVGGAELAVLALEVLYDLIGQFEALRSLLIEELAAVFSDNVLDRGKDALYFPFGDRWKYVESEFVALAVFDIHIHVLGFDRRHVV